MYLGYHNIEIKTRDILKLNFGIWNIAGSKPDSVLKRNRDDTGPKIWLAGFSGQRILARSSGYNKHQSRTSQLPLFSKSTFRKTVYK